MLYPLPNLNLKVVKDCSFYVPEKLNSFLFEKEYFSNLTRIEVDILLVLVHLYLKEHQKDDILYFNTDDVLIFRGVKKIAQKNSFSSGYKKEVRDKVRLCLRKFLVEQRIFGVEYKTYNFAIYFDDEFFKSLTPIKIPIKLVQYNPYKKSWHKDIGYFLTCLKYKKQKTASVQIKKILENIKSDYSFLAPNEVRTRFEDVMDELSQDNVIQNWQYKNIDEDFLCCKHWLWYWQKLSVKIDFENLAQPPSFLNF